MNKTTLRREGIVSRPIGRELVKLTLPMLYALVAIMGLGLVDSFFISFLGTPQLAAIGFIIPITSTINSLGLGMGMAVSSLNSKLIGAQRMDEAARLITDGFYLTALIALLANAALFWQLDTVFSLMGASIATRDFIDAYMHIWIVAGPLAMLTMVAASTFRSLGDTHTSAKITISMTVCNMLLDPLLIFGLGPIPAMGMQGAALATVLAITLGCSIGMYQLAFVERLLLRAVPLWRDFKHNLAALMEIATPAVLANAIIPLTAAVLTRLVAEFGTDAVAGFGVGARIEAFSLLIVYALSSTLPMFIGQNLGAQKPERVRAAIDIAFRFVLLLQLAIYVVLALGGPVIAGWFSDSPAVQQTIIQFLWIVPLSNGLTGVVVLINVAVNVLGRPKLALYINIARLCVFYVPMAWIGGQLGGLMGLYIGIAAGNCAAWLLAITLLKRTLKQVGVPAN
ncbi:MAG: MATE family efflux transporter [Gammaproteobacteria bacterium]|nr:MATE family efflux transporter [Gammaproteobacteria bacterium]